MAVVAVVPSGVRGCIAIGTVSRMEPRLLSSTSSANTISTNGTTTRVRAAITLAGLRHARTANARVARPSSLEVTFEGKRALLE